MDKLKFAAAQINTRACDIAGNISKIEDFWARAEAQNVDLMVTPEQSISGYPLEDMAANPDVLAASKKGLNYLVEKSKEFKTVQKHFRSNSETLNKLIQLRKTISRYHNPA